MKNRIYQSFKGYASKYFFHLWANAYQNDRSAYCEQEVENKQTAFYFSKEDDRGFIDSLHFKIDDEDINISEYNNQEDIQLLELNHPYYQANLSSLLRHFAWLFQQYFLV